MSSIYGTDISEIEDSNIELFKAVRAIDSDTALNSVKTDYVALATLAGEETELTALVALEVAETIDSGVAISADTKVTKIDNTTTGAGAVTLAVPDATMLGQVKTIEMTVDGGDVTLALTNILGGSASTTATFGAVGDTLILVGGISAWSVIAEVGVTLA